MGLEQQFPSQDLVAPPSPLPSLPLDFPDPGPEKNYPLGANAQEAIAILTQGDLAAPIPEVRRLTRENRDLVQLVYEIEGDAKFYVTSTAPAESDSPFLSFGGFRWATNTLIEEVKTKTGREYSPAEDGVDLALGMEVKLGATIRAQTYGPYTRPFINHRMVYGGKNVLLSPPTSRPDTPGREDNLSGWLVLGMAALALENLRKSAESSGNPTLPRIISVTGEDVGQSLERLHFLHRLYRGSVTADTSKPTAWGNFHFIKAFAQGLDLDLSHARIAILGGGGKIGTTLADLLRKSYPSIELHLVEKNPETRQKIQQRFDCPVYSPDQAHLVAKTCHVVAPNALKGSFNDAMVSALLGSDSKCKLVAGCENNFLPVSSKGQIIHAFRQKGICIEDSTMIGHLGGAYALEAATASFAGADVDKSLFFAQAAERIHALVPELLAAQK